MPLSDASRAELAEALAENRANWDQWHRDDPERARLELTLAQAARLEVEYPPWSPIAEQAKREYLKALRELNELFARRRAA